MDPFRAGADSCAPAGTKAPRTKKQTASKRFKSVQKILPVQRIPLRRTETRISYDAPQLFFGGAIVYTGGADDVLFEHHRAHVVAPEAQAHLADLQSLRYPAGLDI